MTSKAKKILETLKAEEKNPKLTSTSVETSLLKDIQELQKRLRPGVWKTEK